MDCNATVLFVLHTPLSCMRSTLLLLQSHPCSLWSKCKLTSGSQWIFIVWRPVEPIWPEIMRVMASGKLAVLHLQQRTFKVTGSVGK